MTTPFQGAAGVGAPGTEADYYSLDRRVDDAAETLSNGVRGFTAAADKLDDADTARLFNELAASRRGATENLLRIAADEGVEFDTDVDGTFTGALHRTWIAIEGTVAGDGAVVGTALKGERHAKNEITDALEHIAVEPVAAALRDALSDIESAIERLEALNT